MRRLLFLSIFLCMLLISEAIAEPSSEIGALLRSARAQVGETVGYDGSYRTIAYPGGDVPSATGVCTDVVIRAYRKLGFDLQRLVHEDLKAHFQEYPSRRIWGLMKPDRNIDHRRVPNLEAFFKRHGKVLSIDLEAEPALPGDLLVWVVPEALPHIGIVSDRKRADGSEYLVIHNIGEGAKEEDVIGRFKLTGHYRYAPWVER